MADLNIGFSAVATGTADVITATYSPAITLSDKRIAFLRTVTPNTTTTPTFNPNGLGAQTITKNNGDPLAVGDLDGVVILMYDLANTNWELLTPKGLGSFTLAQILAIGNSTGGLNIASPDGEQYLSITDAIAMLYSDGGINGAFAGVIAADGQTLIEGGNDNGDGNIQVNSTNSRIQHTDLINLDAPSVKINNEEVATQNYVASAVAGLMDYRGTFDASVNAYPSSGGSGTAGAILKSDFWIVSVAGTLPTGLVVEAGDLVIAKQDTPGNTQANWNIVQYNIGYTPENAANKTDTTVGNESSSTKYPSVKGMYDYLVGLVWFTAQLFGTWINGLTSKATPVDADYVPLMDSAATNTTKKLSWSNIKATLKTYFDTLYVPTSGAAYSRYLGASFTPASGTNTTSEELLQSFQVAAGQINSVSDYLEFYSLLQWNSSANSKNFKVYFSPTNSLSDVNKVQVAQAQQTTNTGSPFKRRFVVKSDTLIRSHTTATSNLAIIDVVTAGANVPTDITVPSLTAGFYVLISGTKALGTDTDTVEYSYLMKISS